MEKLCFADGDKIGVFDGEKVTLFESELILRYREYAETRNKNDEWKYGGEGARFRGDGERYAARRAEKVEASVNGLAWQGEKVVYSFTVNSSSGVYCKDVCDPKAREEHIFSSSDEEILSLEKGGDLLAVTVRRDGLTSSVGALDMRTSELRMLTDGDSRDADPCFSPREEGVLYFDSAGVGRNANGEFAGKFSPSAICAIDLSTMELREVLRDEKDSYVKPKFAPNGDMYYIKRPNKVKSGGNVFLDILLFPFRILKAVFGFLQAFVAVFGHTSLSSQTEGGDNPARGRETDVRKLYIDGCLIEAEKEQKQNRKKGEDGFIPLSWKLMRRTAQGEETVKAGVCDYAFAPGGALFYTNGRHIYRMENGTVRKIADADRCLSLAAESFSQNPADPFSV